MFLRRIGIFIGIILLGISGSTAFTQQNLPPPGGYIPIPNFTGTDAGFDFRSAINDRFSGVQAIAPRVGSVTFANLGPEHDGAVLYCTNCQPSLVCSAGGSGAWAQGSMGQWQCNEPMAALKLDGTDVLPPYNGTRTNEKNILDFGAIASLAQINCSTTSGQANITCSGIGTSDFAVNQYVAIYGAGPAPTVAQPSGLVAQPVTTTNSPSSATRNTRFTQGCTVQNALAWCGAASPFCGVNNVALYEQGQTITIAGAGAGGAPLTTTIANLNDGNSVVLATPAVNGVVGAPITGANCTTTRRYQVFPIDARGGWGTPTAVLTVNNSASALNWGDWVDVQVNVPQPPNAPNPTYPLPSNIPIAWAFYCAEGTAPLQLCGIEVPTYSYLFNSPDPAPWNDQLIGGVQKGFPTVVTFHDLDRPYGHDIVKGTNPPSGPVNQISFAKIISINGNTVQLNVPPAQTGTFMMGHDNGPNINAAISAACQTPSYRCGTVYTPFASSLFPVATPINALRGNGLILQGGGGTVVAEPSAGGSAGWLWTGALGGTMLELNQQSQPHLVDLSLESSMSNFIATTMGVSIDMDAFDPGDGLGIPVGCGREFFQHVYTGQASIGIRLANVNTSNCEFGTIDSSTINWIYGPTQSLSASNIGLLMNSSNALATRIDGSFITGNIGVWTDGNGFSAIQSALGQADGIGVFEGGGYSHPITIDTSRTENLARFVYSALIGPLPGSDGFGTELTLRGNTLTNVRIPNDGGFIVLAGGQSAVFENNELFTPQLGVSGNSPNPFPGGVVLNGGSAPLIAHGNFWSNICGDPYSFIASVSTSGDTCMGTTGALQNIPPYSRGLGGFSFGSPTGGAMGDGTINLSGLVFHNAQPLVNWGEASIASIAASGTGSATISWNKPFTDSSYDFSCLVVDTSGFLTVLGSNSKTTGSVGLLVKNSDTSSAHSGTANCTAVHH